MPTRFMFDNREIILPGAYSTIKSGIKNPSLALAFGNTLIIDTGSGKMWGGGSGINGTLKSGKQAHYTFDNVRDFRNFVRGGPWWLLGGPLFFPGGGATTGISSLTYIKAKTTTPAVLQLLFGDQIDDSDGDGASNNSSVDLQVVEEGFSGNAVLGDETRAQCTVTITNAGSAGNTINIKDYKGEILAEYTVESGDGISDVITGLSASMTASLLATVVSTTSTQITFQAPSGYGADANGETNLITTTGSVAGISGFYSGGVEGTLLTRGYAAKVIEGVLDTSKYIVQFWRGTFRGSDSQLLVTGSPSSFDGLAEISTKPELIVQSPEVSTVQELVDWMDDESGLGYDFNLFFKRSTTSIGTVDEIIDEDITTNWIKASGGTESASSADLASALESIEDLVFDFILADKWGDEARALSNLSIQSYINTSLKIKPDLYVASGSTIGEFNTSIAHATAYDDMRATVVHGGAAVLDAGGRHLKQYKSIYTAAALMGREAGLPPQVPLTFKGIGIQGEVHNLSTKEQKRALGAGLLVTKLDNGSFEVLKGINSLQNNTFLVNPDGTTHSKQLGRIIRQINKELSISAKTVLLKKPNGANRNTVSVEDVKEFVKTFLQARVAKRDFDNLIITFRDVEVVRNQDAYDITYAFEGNTEISFLFFTGFILDSQT